MKSLLTIGITLIGMVLIIISIISAPYIITNSVIGYTELTYIFMMVIPYLLCLILGIVLLKKPDKIADLVKIEQTTEIKINNPPSKLLQIGITLIAFLMIIFTINSIIDTIFNKTYWAKNPYALETLKRLIGILINLSIISYLMLSAKHISCKIFPDDNLPNKDTTDLTNIDQSEEDK